MAYNQLNKPPSFRSRNDGAKIRGNNLKTKDISPKFKELPKTETILRHSKDLLPPETWLNHIQELENPKTPSGDEVLSRLLEGFAPLDFYAEAKPHKAENFKLTHKDYRVFTVENILQTAEINGWDFCKKNDVIYLFNGAYWCKIKAEVLQGFLKKAALRMRVPFVSARDFEFKEKLYSQFLSDAPLAYASPLPKKTLINLKNGTLEVGSKGAKLRPFDRSDFLTYRLPFECDPQAKAPLFEAYLNRVLPDKERQKVLAEYLGFVFIRHGDKRVKAEKALILYGTGANGKSVFFEIVSALLGKENTSNYSLKSLTNDSGYYRARLEGKLVNYASEIRGALESAVFKQLVSGEPVEARLPYGKPFMLRQYAKLIFNCNELPKDVEHTSAYFRRFLIVPFDVTIPPHERDGSLPAKIIENELSGVLNWALDGLDRLLRQGDFTDCEAARRAVEEYKTETDSVKMFINEHDYKNSKSAYKTIKDLYPEYRGYCFESGFKPLNKVNFVKRLKASGILVRRGTGNRLSACIEKAHG